MKVKSGDQQIIIWILAFKSMEQNDFVMKNATFEELPGELVYLARNESPYRIASFHSGRKFWIIFYFWISFLFVSGGFALEGDVGNLHHNVIIYF